MKLEHLSDGDHSKGFFFSERDSKGAQERCLVLEQLSVHYAEEALKVYPASTPFKGLLSGIVAIALYLPAGSPACAICLRLVSERSFFLFTNHQQKVYDEDGHGGEKYEQMGQGYEGDSDKQHGDAAGKLRSLLMAVIPIVDLQVLSVCLREVARLLLQLTASGLSQAEALAELYQVLAASDDYTRKPFTVPFFQSLSYLCAAQEARQAVRGRNDRNIGDVSSRKKGNRRNGGKSGGGGGDRHNSSAEKKDVVTGEENGKHDATHDVRGEDVDRDDNEIKDSDGSLKMTVTSASSDDERKWCRYLTDVGEIEGNSISGGYVRLEDDETLFSRRGKRREPRGNISDERIFFSPRYPKPITMPGSAFFQSQSQQLVGFRPDQVDAQEFEENLVLRSTTSLHEPALRTLWSSGIPFGLPARQSRL